ncbi:MAG: glycerate kinase [Paracoccaceae bacterium]
MPKPLLDIWSTGVDAVRGGTSVHAALPLIDTPVDTILAVGKAACDMAAPAMTAYPKADTTIVTKHDHSTPLPRAAQIIEAGHPIPDAASLRGGQALRDAIAKCHPNTHVLMLVSGGASAVAELLPDGMTLTDWQKATQDLMASGADIHEINTYRKSISLIKGGRLLAGFGGARVTTLAISDVEGDGLDVIGSGIAMAPPAPVFDFTAHIVASNERARQACAAAADANVIINTENLYEDVQSLAPKLGDILKSGPAGLYIFGGEPTVELPANPGRGGRNQALALLLAREIAGRSDLEILVAGTDGSDGPTPDAGGIVRGTTWGEGAQDALNRADAGNFLAQKDALLRTGPTGTNVMDLVIARKS